MVELAISAVDLQRRKLKPRGRPFPKGSSGNPKGRPKEHEDVKLAARTYTRESIERLAFWMRSDDPRASVMAADKLLDRGWGRPTQDLKLQGELLPGLAEIVRQARARALVIDAKPIMGISGRAATPISTTDGGDPPIGVRPARAIDLDPHAARHDLPAPLRAIPSSRAARPQARPSGSPPRGSRGGHAGESCGAPRHRSP